MARSEAHGSWHCVLLIFAFLAILRIMDEPTPDYQNSFVFTNETRQKVSQLPLLMTIMM